MIVYKRDNAVVKEHTIGSPVERRPAFVGDGWPSDSTPPDGTPPVDAGRLNVRACCAEDQHGS